MKASNLTLKGQVTVPVEIRHKLNLKPGDRLAFSVQGDKIIAERIPSDISSMFGIIRSEQSVSVQEMEECIAEAATDQ